MFPGVEFARRRRTSNFSCMKSDRSARSSSKFAFGRDEQQQQRESRVPRSSSEIQEAAANAVATLHARYRFHTADDLSRKAALEARERLEARLRASEVRATASLPPAAAAKEEMGSKPQKLKFSLLKRTDQSPDCSICLEGSGRSFVVLPCNHSFHKECIEPWIERSKHCPYCRAGVV